MPRKIGKPSDVQGAGKQVRIPDDLGSEFVRELAAQLNALENVESVRLSVSSGLTGYAFIGRWRYDIWIKDVAIGNVQTDDFVGANTDIFLKHCSPTDADFAGAGPVSPTTLFGLEGFSGDTFAGPNFVWEDGFIEGTNVTSKTGTAGWIVPAGNCLYAEFVNGEAGARDLEVNVVFAATDAFRMEPRGMQDPYFGRVRAFNRKNRTG